MKEIKYSSKKRTHEKIKQAFAELLAEKKALNNITVAELAERAEVTRGTFYAHYDNIFEVAEELENEFIETLDASAEKMTSVEDFPIYLHQIFVFLGEHEELYRQLLSSDAPILYLSKLSRQIDKVIHESLREHAVDKPMLDLDIAFFTDGATFMILKYFRGEITLSLDEIEWYLKQRIVEMFLK
ncbi:TetR/AcrR family transcriptional regulator [Candidatus Saccharibacteria bacterium]|nr:TetR/AcrR family transcriptional regulator [Candidatus Saccharibacteria bacterium]